MTPLPKPSCPHCGSGDVLPFEDEETHKSDTTVFIVILSAFSLITGYFLFMISAYVFFPAVVIVSIIFTTRLINRREKQVKAEEGITRNYMCADCGQFFEKGAAPPVREAG